MIGNSNFINNYESYNSTATNSVYNQLLYLPVRAFKVSFPKNKVGLGQLIKAVVSRYRSGTENANDYTRGRWLQLLHK
jgi:hypothetical protein